jgi:hypothetical protein
MTYYEAALQILSSARHPLSTREITDRAIERGLVAPRGATPQATMAAELYRRLGSDSRLVKIGTPDEGRAKPGSVRWALRAR